MNLTDAILYGVLMGASTTIAFALHIGLSKLSEAISGAGKSISTSLDAVAESWGMEAERTYIPFDEVEGLKLPDLNPPEKDLVFNDYAGAEAADNDQEFI